MGGETMRIQGIAGRNEPGGDLWRRNVMNEVSFN